MKLRITNSLIRQYIQDFLNHNTVLLNIVTIDSKLLSPEQMAVKVQVWEKIQRVFSECTETYEPFNDIKKMESLTKKFGAGMVFGFFENNKIRFTTILDEKRTEEEGEDVYIGISYRYINHRVKSKVFTKKRKNCKRNCRASRIKYKNSLSKLD